MGGLLKPPPTHLGKNLWSRPPPPPGFASKWYGYIICISSEIKSVINTICLSKFFSGSKIDVNMINILLLILVLWITGMGLSFVFLMYVRITIRYYGVASLQRVVNILAADLNGYSL